jgi:hypothetical protein
MVSPCLQQASFGPQKSLRTRVHAAVRGAGIGKAKVMLPWNC